VPRGGPAGGGGGHGGSVYLCVDSHKRTLLDFQYRHVFKAEDGRPGAGATKTGKSAKDLKVAVPPGTVVYDTETGEQVADLVHPKDRLLAARGGAGGRGNAAFATPTRQAPRFAEMGEKGEEFGLRLELKLIADVGIVGFPNVGKSTLISRISAAKPKIAPYHFTTLEPNLGVVRADPEHSFVVADVPGLIEGAHAGVGLGHQFLRHIERTRMLVHLVDVAGTEGRDPVEDYRIISRELELHDPRVAQLPQVVALNKIDVLQEPDNLQRMVDAASADGRKCLRISAVTGEGIPELVTQMAAGLAKLTPEAEPETPAAGPREFVMPTPPHRRLDVRRMAPNIYLVRGTDVETVLQRADLDSEAGVEWLHGNLDVMGVLQRLEEMGAEPGDTVLIGDAELEYTDG
jgi:GTP-binding protein